MCEMDRTDYHGTFIAFQPIKPSSQEKLTCQKSQVHAAGEKASNSTTELNVHGRIIYQDCLNR